MSKGGSRTPMSPESKEQEPQEPIIKEINHLHFVQSMEETAKHWEQTGLQAQYTLFQVQIQLKAIDSTRRRLNEALRRGNRITFYQETEPMTGAKRVYFEEEERGPVGFQSQRDAIERREVK